MKGRGKGSQFERDLCRELSLWWTEGKRDDVFWRTSQSGGRSKTRMKTGRSTYGQYGDIQAVDPVGKPLMDLVTVECKKGYNREPCFNALDKKPIAGKLHKCQWEKFLEQAQQDSQNAKIPFWLLIHKRDARATCVFLPGLLYEKLEGLLRYARPALHMTLETGLEVFCTTLDQFKENVVPSDIRWTRDNLVGRVIRVRKIG